MGGYIKFTKFKNFINEIKLEPFKINSQILLEFTSESNKEEFLGEYIRYLVKENVNILLFTQDGNSSFYLEDFSDNRILTLEITVMDSILPKFQFKKLKNINEYKRFSKIRLNKNKILFSIKKILQEFGGKKSLLIIFDSLSDIILWRDFKIAYKFVRECISYLRQKKHVFSIFLINKKSHSSQELAAFKTLFDGFLISNAFNTCEVEGVIKKRYVIR